MQIKIIKNNIISCILALVLCVSTVLFIFTESLGKTMDEQAYSQTMLLVHILQRDNIDPVKDATRHKGRHIRQNNFCIYKR